jgi:hypothetical protein
MIKRQAYPTFLAGIALLALTGCVAPSADPIPQAAETDASSSKTSGAKAAKPRKAAEPSVSSCDQVREAILTGTPAEIKAAMKRLVADRKADGTAREYAQYYLKRDAKQPDMREMDVTLIQTACTV